MAIDVEVARRRFTREEYRRMGEVGIFKPADRVELMSGDIVAMSPIGPRPYAFVNTLAALFIRRLHERAIVGLQGPLALSPDTEPQPDLAILRHRSTPYKVREAVAADVLLIVEVADRSLAYDRSTKLGLYAAAGISEYWIVDCAAEAVEVYRAPEGAAYRQMTRVDGAMSVSPQAFPDVVLPLAEIFA